MCRPDQAAAGKDQKMADILTRAAALICMIALAFTLKKIHILKKEDFRVVSALVVKITLPCAIINNFSQMDSGSHWILRNPLSDRNGIFYGEKEKPG